MTSPPTTQEDAPKFRYTGALAQEIELRWQDRWEAEATFATPNPTGPLADAPAMADRPKVFVLDMFPYPSGTGLHVGHPLGFIGTDIYSRYKRMTGHNVMYTMGFDAFGLPAEQYAVETGQHPKITTDANVATYRRQLRRLGLSHDARRSINTTDPAYYRWTQWIFLQIFNSWYDHDADRARPIEELIEQFASGERPTPDGRPWPELTESERDTTIEGYRLAYVSQAPVNWCPGLGTVVANEEGTADGRSDRGNFPVFKRNMRQWMMRITAYADRLIGDLDLLEWSDAIKAMQRNWIGRSEGATVHFESPAGPITVFTARPDTLFGATFMVLAPEHPLVDVLTAPDRRTEVDAYVAQARRRTEIDRLSTDREKTGVAIGADAVNPVNGERIPIYVADYVLAGYGTGAIMAVPAHDERDFAFARQFGLSIRRVVAAPGTDVDDETSDAYVAHSADERLVNSGRFDGMSADEGGREIVEMLAKDGKAQAKVTYRLRDWLISRQRYWGTPIPIIFCERDGIVPVPYEDLPVRLPENVDYRGRGDNPLNHDEAFLNVTCPRCGQQARRETDTMDTFVDSSWYWYRYLSPDKDDGPVDRGLAEVWTPVDQYTGGAEHAVMHLLYSRFWTKAMRDIGLIDDDEPFKRLFNQGQILGADGERMSKSRGNVEDPDQLVSRYGADTVRLFLMFMGPWDQGGPWSPTGIGGVHRFLNRLWTIALDPHGREPGDPDSGRLPDGVDEPAARLQIRQAAHRTLKGVTADYEAFHFNTMIAKLMELANLLMRFRGSAVAGSPEWDEAVGMALLMLAPAAPHITEELWSRRLAEAGRDWSTIHREPWPEVDPGAVVEATREVPIQVNGKLRDRITVATDIAPADL